MQLFCQLQLLAETFPALHLLVEAALGGGVFGDERHIGGILRNHQQVIEFFQAILHLLDADFRLLHGLLGALQAFLLLLVLGIAEDFGNGFIVLRGFLWSVERGVRGVALPSSLRSDIFFALRKS